MCLSAGMPMLSTYYTYSKNDLGGFVINMPEENFPRHIQGAPRIPGVNAEAWTFAPHALASLLLTNLWRDPQWNPKDTAAGTRSGEADVEASAVRTVCNPTVMKLGNDTKNFALPNLQEYDMWSPEDVRPDSYAHISPPARFHEQVDSSWNMTSVFLPPSPEMSSVTTGLLVLGPRNETGERFALACSVDARWNKALHTMADSGDPSIGNPGTAISAKLCGRHSRSSGLKESTLPIPGDNGWRHIAAEEDALDAALGFATKFTVSYQPHAIEHESYTYHTTSKRRREDPLLAHTSSGIRSLRTMGLRMKIRTRTDNTRSRKGEEKEDTLQMILASNGEENAADRFNPVLPDKFY